MKRRPTRTTKTRSAAGPGGKPNRPGHPAVTAKRRRNWIGRSAVADFLDNAAAQCRTLQVQHA